VEASGDSVAEATDTSDAADRSATQASD